MRLQPSDAPQRKTVGDGGTEKKKRLAEHARETRALPKTKVRDHEVLDVHLVRLKQDLHIDTKWRILGKYCEHTGLRLFQVTASVTEYTDKNGRCRKISKIKHSEYMVLVIQGEYKESGIGRKGRRDIERDWTSTGVISSGYSCLYCDRVITQPSVEHPHCFMEARGRATQSAVKVKCFCCLIACFTVYPYQAIDGA